MTDRHGPLPPLLLLLTVVTGLVVAVSYLKLGHVFVANMTGNVVFLGFALGGAPDLSAPASLTAMGAFLALTKDRQWPASWALSIMARTIGATDLHERSSSTGDRNRRPRLTA
jgi:uncharacterized membrane protein YoaK (UPF0700 family)